MARTPRLPALAVGPAVLDRTGRRVLIEGHVVHLPAREAAILEQLMCHPGRVLSDVELLGGATTDAAHRRQLARLARRLTRRLMVSPLLPPLIDYIPHSGYRFTSIATTPPDEPA